DLVSAREDGELLFHGRRDGQVKLRGFRVELAEIEAVLIEDHAIRAAVVTLTERDGRCELAAHVVAADPARGIARHVVLERLPARLPAYMVPAFLDVVPELPTLTSGKVDRRRLPPAAARLVRAERARRAPRMETEAAIARVALRVLRVDSLSIDD